MVQQLQTAHPTRVLFSGTPVVTKFTPMEVSLRIGTMQGLFAKMRATGSVSGEAQHWHLLTAACHHCGYFSSSVLIFATFILSVKSIFASGINEDLSSVWNAYENNFLISLFWPQEDVVPFNTMWMGMYYVSC